MKAELQKTLLGLHARRFREHRIYLRTVAGTRWTQRRNQVLQGRRPEIKDAEKLKMVDKSLQDELELNTDKYIFHALRMSDAQKGAWVAEDPSLDRVLAMVQQQTR